jgi:fatty acid desaturase
MSERPRESKQQSYWMQADEEKAWIREAHGQVKDLFIHNARLYWVDLIITALVAWICTVFYFQSSLFSVQQAAFMFIAAVAFYRGGTFMHEIIHMPRGELRGFKLAWNGLIGVPLLLPWIMYRNHIEHHSRQHFGTPRDGEYYPLAAAPFSETLLYLVKLPFLSLLALARFAVLAPLSYLYRPLRDWVLSHASAYASNPYYTKRFPEKELPSLTKVEWVCFAWVLLWVSLTVFGPVEPVHWLMAWALHSLTLALNWVRNLAAHSYSNRGLAMSHLAQLEDSVNLVGQTWLTVWLFPVGLRYHALHHLFPGLPYHNLGRAHHRLMQHFGDQSPYASANHENFFMVVSDLLRSAIKTSRQDSAIPAWRTEHQN